jgi:hypothetical protein
MLRNWLLRFASRATKVILGSLLLRQNESAATANISERELDSVLNRLHGLVVQAQDSKRRIAAERGKLPHEIFSHDRKELLAISVMSQSSPWLKTRPRRIEIPRMLTDEEECYYAFIGRFYEGIGRAVELGPWLGASTHHIVESLIKNPRFSGEQLHVFDDFVWRTSWMDQHVSEADRLANHASFRHLFDRHTMDIAELLKVNCVKITDHDGNEDRLALSWPLGPRDPIEFLYVDCGRTIEVNAAWYKCLRPAFVPERTLIIMQDWRLHREVPRRWFNQTLFFTQERENELKLVHEVSTGGLATFLFNPTR